MNGGAPSRRRIDSWKTSRSRQRSRTRSSSAGKDCAGSTERNFIAAHRFYERVGREPDPSGPRPTIAAQMASLELGDPLAHRALQALLRAEATVRKRLALQLEREGVTAAGFSVLVVLTTAGGSLELKTLRRRLGWSKANATEVTGTLAARG